MSFRKPSWHQQVRDLTKQYQELYKQCEEWKLYFITQKTFYERANKINKKNLEYFKRKLRDCCDEPVELLEK